MAKNLVRVLAKALLEEVSDPALRGVMVTATRLSPDLNYARVWWYLQGGPDKAAVAAAEAGFVRAAPKLRRIVGREIRMRTTPELRFEYDEGIDEARRIDALLDKVAGTRDEAPDAPAAPEASDDN